MTLNSDFITRVTDTFSADAPSAAMTELDDGHVGRVCRLDFDGRDPVAAKVGNTPLDVEAAMLDSLAVTGFPVPAVHHADPDLLVLDYVGDTSELTSTVKCDLTTHPAVPHKATAPAFSFPYNALSGPYRQPNPWADPRITFLRNQRLLSWIEAALGLGLPDAMIERVESVAADLDDFLVEPAAPRLAHGDARDVNSRVRDARVVAFLDLARYYGHPEVELAYIDRFDVVGGALFDAYDECRPVTDGFFEYCSPVYALFPLLEHIRIFGVDYVPSVEDVLDELGY